MTSSPPSYRQSMLALPVLKPDMQLSHAGMECLTILAMLPDDHTLLNETGRTLVVLNYRSPGKLALLCI